MKSTYLLLLLLLTLGSLKGNTYLIPSTEQLADRSDLIVIGSIEAIKKTQDSEIGVSNLAEKEITILIHVTLKGSIEKKVITVTHTYENTDVEELRRRSQATIKKIETLELDYAKRLHASEKFADSNEGAKLKKKILALQDEQMVPLIEHMRIFRPTPYDIKDSWQPSKDEEFIIFLSKDGEEYSAPYGNINFRKMSYLDKLPKHAYKL